MSKKIAGADGLVPTLLVFKAYPCMYSMDLPAPNIIQKAAANQKTMDEVRKIRAKNLIAYTLNTRYRLVVDFIYDLPLNSNVLAWGEDNIG